LQVSFLRFLSLRSCQLEKKPSRAITVFPLVIGSGKRLFSEGTIPSGLKLVDSKVFTTGVVIGTYEPAGEIITGSFALD
jgi:hypothetical protein